MPLVDVLEVVNLPERVFAATPCAAELESVVVVVIGFRTNGHGRIEYQNTTSDPLGHVPDHPHTIRPSLYHLNHFAWSSGTPDINRCS